MNAKLGRTIILTSSEIHLWLAFYNEIKEERLFSAYRELLSPSELEQEARFYFVRDRRRYLVTRALTRLVLSRYAPIHPTEWIFSTNAYGRPEIANSKVMDTGLSFNISHTHSLIVLGVTRDRALGVDVENFRAREIDVGIAERFFAPQEVVALKHMPSQLQQYRFFEYWTFKESYIKARSMGLSLPLDKFSFHYPDDRTVEITIDPELRDEASRWQFWQLQPKSEYLVAICAERVGGQSTRLIVRQVIPIVSEETLDVEVLRVSK